jgi:hypothetical protein
MTREQSQGPIFVAREWVTMMNGAERAKSKTAAL